MFLIARGKRVLLMQSFRDGRGKPLQRRLYTFESVQELRGNLAETAWKQLRGELERRYPEVKGDWDALRRKGHEISRHSGEEAPSTAAERASAMRRLARRLRRLLEQERDPDVLESVEADVQLLARFGAKEASSPERRLEEGELLLEEADFRRAEEAFRKAKEASLRRLPSGRTRFEASDPVARTYLLSLEKLAVVLERAERWHEAIEVLQERLAACPEPGWTNKLGILLQRAGRTEEAIDAYQRLPAREAARHYNEASALLQGGRQLDALAPLLRGMARDQNIAVLERKLRRSPRSVHAAAFGEAQRYWQNFGPIWGERARAFLAHVAGEPLVRFRLRRLGNKGARVRKVFPKSVLSRLLEVIQKKMAA